MPSNERTPVITGTIHHHWREITRAFLKLGAMSYGGPAIMGLMQAEIQERRGWLSKERFLEGLALVNMLPGAGATQLGIFLGYTRAGWWGGLLAGVCFVLPAFFIMLALTLLYSEYGTLAQVRKIFYGLNSVVVAIFAVAVFRLGRNTLKDWKQAVLGIAGGLVLMFTPVGVVPILLMGGALGVALYASPRWGMTGAIVIALAYGMMAWLMPDTAMTRWLGSATTDTVYTPGILQLSTFFFMVGAFTFGGGLSMLAFIQEQAVNQFHWLTAQEFIDGLALGQLTPGPILMLAAFVGYKVASLWGAVVASIAIFLPSFLFMLSILPVYERMQRIGWMKAALRGISPVVIGMITIALIRMLPAAIPAVPAAVIAVLAGIILLKWNTSPFILMIVGSSLGMIISFG